MKNVYILKCTQHAPEYKENKEIIEYEDTLEKYESVTSEEYIRSRKRLTDRICSAALPDRLPYNYCIERDDKEQKGTVYMTGAFATKLATLAYGLSEWLLEYYAGTRCFARLNFDNCDALTDVQTLPIANHVLNEEEGDLYDVTWKRYAETAAKDLIPKEGLSDKKYAAVCRFYDDDYGFLEKPDALKSKAELRAEAKQRAKEEKEYINSLPRSERKAAREEIKRKREQEEAEKKAKEAERERIINEAIKKRLDKAERVKTAQYYEKFMEPEPSDKQETDKPEENGAELNSQAVEFKPVTVGPSDNAVQDDIDIFDSEKGISTDEVDVNADTELFENDADTDIQAPQFDEVVLDVDDDSDDLSVDIEDIQPAQPTQQSRGQAVVSDGDVSPDDVDLFDDSKVSRTEVRVQNVKAYGKMMNPQKQPQATQGNSDIDYMSLNDISIFDDEE